MMNEADIFHRAMLPFGGRFDTDSDPRMHWWRCYTPLANDIIALTKRVVPRMPDVHFHLINNPSVQAYAFADQGFYFIGVHTGTLYLLDSLFARFLSDRRILPWVGNPQLELADPLPPIDLRIEADKACAAGLTPWPPRCDTRREFKNRLTGDMFHFLMLHELTHIAAGHVDFYPRRFGAQLLSELGWVGKSETDCLTRQSWEVMADAKAVFQLLGNLPQMNADQAHPMPLEQVVFMFTFGVCVLFRMFGDEKFTGQESTQAYPPMRLRQALCMHTTDLVMETWPADQRPACVAARDKAIWATEEAFSLLTGTPLAIDGLREAYEAVHSYSGKIVDHFRSVTVPELLPYSYDPFIRQFAQ